MSGARVVAAMVSVAIVGLPAVATAAPTPPKAAGGAPAPVVTAADAQTKAVATEALGKLPLRFETNVGQVDPQVRFTAKGAGYDLFLTGDKAVMSLTRTADPADASAAQATKVTASVGLALVGGNPKAAVKGMDRQAGVTNYILGNDPSKWHTQVPGYGRVVYQGVYPGISLVYHGASQGLEYDFDVAPGANPADIAWNVTGSDSVVIDAAGNLVIATPAGPLTEACPHLYQNVAGQQRTVSGGFVLRGGDRVGFDVGSYDRTKPLVIDPVVAYSTYLGGSFSEVPGGIAVDASGSAYVTGSTKSADYPTTPDAFQTTALTHPKPPRRRLRCLM